MSRLRGDLTQFCWTRTARQSEDDTWQQGRRSRSPSPSRPASPSPDAAQREHQPGRLRAPASNMADPAGARGYVRPYSAVFSTTDKLGAVPHSGVLAHKPPNPDTVQQHLQQLAEMYLRPSTPYGVIGAPSRSRVGSARAASDARPHSPNIPYMPVPGGAPLPRPPRLNTHHTTAVWHEEGSTAAATDTHASSKDRKSDGSEQPAAAIQPQPQIHAGTVYVPVSKQEPTLRVGLPGGARLAASPPRSPAISPAPHRPHTAAGSPPLAGHTSPAAHRPHTELGPPTSPQHRHHTAAAGAPSCAGHRPHTITSAFTAQRPQTAAPVSSVQTGTAAGMSTAVSGSQRPAYRPQTAAPVSPAHRPQTDITAVLPTATSAAQRPQTAMVSPAHRAHIAAAAVPTAHRPHTAASGAARGSKAALKQELGHIATVTGQQFQALQPVDRPASAPHPVCVTTCVACA